MLFSRVKDVKLSSTVVVNDVKDDKQRTENGCNFLCLHD